MSVSASPSIQFAETGQRLSRLRLTGDWTIAAAGDLERRLAEAVERAEDGLVFDGAGIGLFDTAGALILRQARRHLQARGKTAELTGFSAKHLTLIEAIEPTGKTVLAPHETVNPLTRILERVGRETWLILDDLTALLATLGEASVAIGEALMLRRRMRWPALFNHIDRAGIQAVPIIALMSFLIGMIVAQQGAFYFRTYGAELYVVDLVGVLVCREIGVLLTAIMVAGRSGSAFTAEIGSMKMREEVDALSVLGVSPTDVLVVPRLLALIIALPILALVADLAALAGAWVVVVFYIGIPTETFFIRLQEALTPLYVAIGLVKAPFMALLIALIACVEGLKVEGSAESLGIHTTASVVKAIFLVVVMDGVFAIIFGAVGI